MSNYKEFPEIIAMLIFLPVGVFMGHMMNYVQTTTYAASEYYGVKYWPFVVGGVAAIITGGIHLAIKQKYKQYKYEHMYFQMIGLVMLMASGGLLMSTELPAAGFLGFIGHGIIYVSALSYVNIRTGKSKYRYLKLSVPHLVYLIGVGLGATLVWTANKVQFYYSDQFQWWNYYYEGMSTGTVLLVISSVFMGALLINEVLQQTMHSYNYKQSLDDDFNRENTNKEILKNKYFHITPPHLNFPATSAHVPQMPLKTESSGVKEFGYLMYAIATKILTLMFFYYPFIYLHAIASTLAYDENIFQVKWFGTIGIVISLIFMAIISYKINYLLGIVIKTIFMIVILIFFSYDYILWFDMKILFYFVYIGLGFGFSHADINILSYTGLRTNEIALGLGYFVEHLIIGILQFETVFYPENIFDDTSNFYFIFAHALTFILILVFVGMLGIFMIPNGKHSSLLEIKNILNNCANINQLVNTGNYDGQQNPQLYYQQQNMYLQQNYPQMAQMQPQQVPPMPYDPNSGYRPPYANNMFQYGQPQNYPQQQYYPQPPQPQYQQTPYINTTQIPGHMDNTNSNFPPNYSEVNDNKTALPGVTSMPPQQNIQNLPPNIAPMMNNAYIPPPPVQHHQIGKPPQF